MMIYEDSSPGIYSDCSQSRSIRERALDEMSSFETARPSLVFVLDHAYGGVAEADYP
jgi:hypothetical protein